MSKNVNTTEINKKKVLISRQQFCDIMEFMRDKDEKFEHFCSAMEDLCPGEYVNFFVNFDYDTQIFKLLNIIFGFENDSNISSPIERFAIDYEYGRNYPDRGEISSDGSVIDFSSAGAVYDYIVSII